MALVHLSMEAIGGRGSCARVLGFGPRGVRTAPMQPYRDFSKANSVGSRGVIMNFFLEEGEVYEVIAPVTWKRTDQYFCRVEGTSIIRMSFEEIVACLNAHSA